MHRLTQATLTVWRDSAVTAQGGRCALCGDPFSDKNPAVADHDHRTGQMRAALHRGCNAALGHVENNAPRYFLTDLVRLARWASRLATYLHPGQYVDQPLHPTHRTADEKRLLKNKRARVARAKKAPA